jgi:recombination associated protein RdgC
MDLVVDIMAGKAFLGQEFLIWLWFVSEEQGGPLLLPGGSLVTAAVERHIVLESGEGETLDRITCSGLHSELLEARTGLLAGKKIEQARLHIIKDDKEFWVTLTGSTFEYRGVHLPKISGADQQDELAMAGQALDILGLYEELHHTIDGLFSMFLAKRLHPEIWGKIAFNINRWIKQAL